MFQQDLIRKIVTIMLFQTDAVTGADSRKLCGLLIIKMANVFGQAGQGSGLTNDKQRLR